VNREEIEKILPHRADMALLDEVELVGGESVGKYTVRGDEFFLNGHFPGNPIVPGVIQCEMMAQSACLLTAGRGGSSDSPPLLTGMDGIKFRNPVRPGDTLILRSRIEKQKGPFTFISCSAEVNGKVTASGHISFAVMPGKA